MKWDLRGWRRPHVRVSPYEGDGYRIEADIGYNWVILVAVLLVLVRLVR